MSSDSDETPMKVEQEEGVESMDEENHDKSQVPLALGLHRVGTVPPPKQSVAQPVQVLNARGMPARIRKRNKLFFDDDIVNDSKSFRSNASPRKSSKNSTPTKSPMKLMKKRKVAPVKYTKVKEEEEPIEQEEDIKPEPTKSTTTLIPFDKKIGQQIGLRLRNLLKLPKAHKWVSFEFFYSFIDKAIFDGENDFQSCLAVTFPLLRTRKMTRTEWSKVRAIIGKPRRCSQAFFDAERRELERRRQKVRLLQTRRSINPNFVKDLPLEIPLPLPVGTKVTARLRQPQDGLFIGTVDAVDSLTSTYRIVFDRPGLGTHSIPDYEILANDYNETVLVAHLTQEFRPKIGGTPMSASPAHSRSFLNKSDPLLGQELHDTQLRNMVLQRETIGGYPIKLLEAIVRLKKTLINKNSKIQKLKIMNNEAEKQKSYNIPYSEDFQKRYAGLVLAIDKVNRDIHDYVDQMQTYSVEIAKEPHIASMINPTYLREKCRESAIESVERNNANSIHDTTVLNLITHLATLMLVASHFASGENTHVLKVLEGCVEEVKCHLDSSNVEIFQKNVQIHMHHIQLGLSQVANNSNTSS